MKILTKALAKGALSAVAAGAMVLAAATPAAAQDRHRDRDRDDDRIGAGEIIAGAVVLGGLAAILSSGNNDRDDYRYRDRDYRGDYRNRDRDYRDDNYRGDYGDYNNGYDGHGRNSSRRAVEQCVSAAEQEAQRYSGSRAEVFEIRDVERERRGYEIEGRIALRGGYNDRGYRDRGNRDRGWGGDYRRGHRNDGWEEGRFECEYRNGRVVDVNFSGLRGL